MRSVGIDIGSFSVKVCVVEATKKGLYLERFSERVLVSTNPFDRNIEVIEFLRTELGDFDPLQTKFVASVPQDLVSVHTKIFPFKDRIKIFRSLPFELEEDTPFNPEDTIFDGRIVRIGAALSEVLACACPKETVKRFVQLMSDSGINLNLLTPEGFAFSNHFEPWAQPIPTVTDIFDPSQPSELPQAPRSCRLVLNLGHTKTVLLVLEGDILVDIRSIAWGGDTIAKLIQEKYNISYSEALKQLQANSFILTSLDNATQDQIYFSNVISTVVSELIRELRLVLMEIQASYNVNLVGVSLTGGTSRIQGLGPYLTQGLELPVNKLSVLEAFPLSKIEKSARNEAICATAIGLAIESLRKPRNPAASFLRGEFAVQSHALRNFLEAWGTTLKFAAAATVALYVYAGFRESTAQTMVEEADNVMRDQAQSRARLKGAKASEAGIEKFIKEKRKTIKELKDLEIYVGMNSALEVMKKVNDAVPGRATLRMEVRKLTINDNRVRMEGYVTNAADTKMLRETLVGLASQQKIDNVPVQITIPPGKIGFGYEFNVDRNVKVSKVKTPKGSSQE